MQARGTMAMAWRQAAARCIVTPTCGHARVLLPSLLVCWAMVVVGCGPSHEKASSLRETRSEVRGRVMSEGQPVPDATVRYRGTSVATRTDARGQFQLPAPPRVEDPPVVTASREGYLIASQPMAREPLAIELAPLPTLDHEDYAWVHPDPDAARPGNCGNCHGEIHEQWSTSAHARGIANRRFLNLYEGSNWQGEFERGWSLVAEHPEGLGVCAACHTPSADLEHLAIGDIREVDPVAARGVHCDFCHKVQDSPLARTGSTVEQSGEDAEHEEMPQAPRADMVAVTDANRDAATVDALGLAHGRFGLTLLRPESPREQLFFGPLDDVDRGEDSFASIYRDSRYCASCHEGTVFGVPVYTTYSEWLASPARSEGKQCQGCHMRPSGTMTNIAPGAGGLERDPRSLASHEMLPGGRLAMLRQCLQLEARWEAPSTTAPGTPAPDSLSCNVQVRTHGVGHRVPTGFIDRHLLLVVEGYDDEDRPVAARSGPLLPEAAGDLRGLPGRVFARRWVDPSTDMPLPFWRPGGSLSDNRLEPESTRAETFTFPPSVARIRVRLLFRGFWADTARDKGWPDDTLTIHECQLRREAP